MHLEHVALCAMQPRQNDKLVAGGDTEKALCYRSR
jgi:hypothetical protein